MHSSIGIWGLREEARESWDHFVSDEVIYFAETSGGNRKFSHVLAEKYLHGELWLEMHFTARVGQQREMHFQVIVEVADEMLPLTRRTGQSNCDLRAIRGDHAMLIHFPEFVQLPKEITLVVIRSCRAAGEGADFLSLRLR